MSSSCNLMMCFCIAYTATKTVDSRSDRSRWCPGWKGGRQL